MTPEKGQTEIIINFPESLAEPSDTTAHDVEHRLDRWVPIEPLVMEELYQPEMILTGGKSQADRITDPGHPARIREDKLTVRCPSLTFATEPPRESLPKPREPLKCVARSLGMPHQGPEATPKDPVVDHVGLD